MLPTLESITPAYRRSDAGEAVLAAIKERRSIGKCSSDVPDRLLIERIVESGTWAPNHHLTEPWRFFILHGDARVRLGEVMGQVAAAHELCLETGRVAAERAASKPLRAPWLIAIAVEPADDPSIPEIEEIAAGCAAAQNMLLAAEALGLAAIWRSGWITYEPEIKAFFGLTPRAQMLGFLYVGCPAMKAPVRTRKGVGEVTTWMGEEP